MNKQNNNLSSVESGKLLLFQALWDNTSDNMFIVKIDENGDFINESCNSSLEKTFNSSPGSLDGIRIKDVLDQKSYSLIAEKYNQCISLMQAITYDEKVVLDDSGERYFNTTILPIIENDEIRIFGISREMTALVQQEQEKLIIEQTKNAQMIEMIENIAHHWFQPLSVISTAASGLKLEKNMGVVSKEREDSAIDSIIENTQYLSDVINTFKHSINHKKEFKEVILQDRLNYAINSIKASLDNNNINLICDFKNCIEPIKIKTVIGEISNVVLHIINNSKDALIKNTIDNPYIKITLDKKDKSVLLSIEDNGGGISEEIMPKIFDLYFTTKHKAQGIGISLFICKRIIQEHLRGKISASNTENGTIVTIELPL